MSEDVKKLFDERLGRYQAAIALEPTDRIPIASGSNYLAEVYSGNTNQETLYDSDKWLQAELAFCKAFPEIDVLRNNRIWGPLFDTVDTVKECIAVLAALMENVRFNRKRMFEEAARGFATATDVAEYLVMKGVAFREAHRIVGEVVGYCLERGKTFEDLTLKELRSFYGGFDRSVYSTFGVARSVQARDLVGGTAKKAVLRRIEDIERSEGHRLR